MPFPFVVRISGEGVTFLSDVVESLLGGMALGFGWPLAVAEGVGAAWLGSAVTAGCCGDAVRFAADSVEGLSLLSVGEGLLMSEAAEGSGLLAGEAADLTACCRLSWLGGGLSTCFLRNERRRTKGLWLLVDGRGVGTRNLETYPIDDSLRDEPLPDGGGPCRFRDMPSRCGPPIRKGSEPRRPEGSAVIVSDADVFGLTPMLLRDLAWSTTSTALARLARLLLLV